MMMINSIHIAALQTCVQDDDNDDDDDDKFNSHCSLTDLCA
jgi:hypothetical protein